jgi:ribosomal protein L11 methyltransferase
MDYVSLILQPDFNEELLWSALEQRGCAIHYIEENPGEDRCMVGFVPREFRPKILETFPDIKKIHSREKESVDWAQQWEDHAWKTENGKLIVDLTELGCSATSIVQQSPLLLSPGPGFGDLSHTTSQLMILVMEGKLRGKRVIDIGCGSGILSFAAIALGAKDVLGIDIDLAAVEHAIENAKLNDMEESCSFIHPEQCIENKEPSVILINMILSEQELAWKELKESLNPKIIISSGILSEEKDKALKLGENWGWKADSFMERDGWLAIHWTS